MSEPPIQQGAFPQTRWSLVLNAKDPAALSTLCQTYWLPIFTYARRLRSSTEDAEDLTQAFFENLLSKDTFSNADQSRGKLRSFLLRSLQNFANTDWHHSQRQKRGGGVAQISLDNLEPGQRISSEPSEDLTPEVQFDRAWASQLLEDVLSKLGESYTAAGKGELFNALREQLVPAGDQKPYQQVAEELGVSEPSIRFAAFKFRSRYRDLLRETIAETVTTSAEVEEELRHLRSVFGN